VRTAQSELLMRAFADAVRHFRARAGLSQEHFADLAGLHRTHVSLIERCHRMPTLETVWNMAAALGVTASKLLAEMERRCDT
jgi:transcriptional regulator with XRE-family HTH domain